MRLKRVLLPDAMATALQSSIRTYGQLQYEKLKRYLKMSSEAEEVTMSQTPISALDFQRSVKATELAASKKGEPQINVTFDEMSDSKGTRDDATQQKNSKDSVTTGSSLAKPSANNLSPDLNSVLRFLPSLKRSEGDWGEAVDAFKKSLTRNWSHLHTMDNGAIIVSGRMEFSGSRSKIKIDILAAYSPKTGTLDLIRAEAHPPISHKLVARG